LKHHFRDFAQVAFLNAQDAKKEFARPFETLELSFIDFNKVAFKDDQMADNDFSFHLLT
jgi:hypothetical protein